MTDNIADLISRVEEASNKAGLVGWQFAADGKWDIAKRIFFEHSHNQDADQIQRWLNQQPKKTENVAFEALFDMATGERFFFGVRITNLNLAEKATHIHGLMNTCQKGHSLSKVVHRIRTILDDQQLARKTPDYLQLGVFDLWNRVKSLVVWQRNEKLGAQTAIILPEEIPGQTPKPDKGFAALHAPQTKRLMLEAAGKPNIENGLKFQCWISLPVSEYGKIPKKHTLSNDRYPLAATTFIGSGALQLLL